MIDKKLTFLPENKSVEIKGEANLLELALNNNVEISHSCGGMGTCTTCRVFVDNSVENLPPRSDLESEVAHERNFKENERLACQTPPYSGWVVRVPSGKI